MTLASGEVVQSSKLSSPIPGRSTVNGLRRAAPIAGVPFTWGFARMRSTSLGSLPQVDPGSIQRRSHSFVVTVIPLGQPPAGPSRRRRAGQLP